MVQCLKSIYSENDTEASCGDACHTLQNVYRWYRLIDVLRPRPLYKLVLISSVQTQNLLLNQVLACVFKSRADKLILHVIFGESDLNPDKTNHVHRKNFANINSSYSVSGHEHWNTNVSESCFQASPNSIELSQVYVVWFDLSSFFWKYYKVSLMCLFDVIFRGYLCSQITYQSVHGS